MDQDILKIITHSGIEGIGRYYSIYRGMVINNDDPKGMNRVKVYVPGIEGGIQLWALPKGQQGSSKYSFKLLPPQFKDLVWVSFEGGDLTKPVWEYYGWSIGDIDNVLFSKDRMGITTPNGHQIVIDDSKGNGSLEIYVNGNVNVLAEKDINVVSKGELNLAGDNGVSVNGGDRPAVNGEDLTNKLNQLVQELESLKTAFNSHIHSVPAAPGVSATPSVPYNNTFSTFTKTDYEDNSFTH